MMNKFKCHNCGLEVEIRSCPVCETSAHILDLNNPIDAFIANGGFDKAFNDVLGLPIGVVKALGEVS